jgi:hypothetical protein
MHALRFAASGTRDSNSWLNFASWHQHVAPGEPLAITHALSPPHNGQFSWVI